MTDHVEIRAGAYHDSVTLMQASRAVLGVPGVESALVAMATDLNLGMLGEMGFSGLPAAGPNDLVVAIRAGDADAVGAGIAALAAALRPPAHRSKPAEGVVPRTVGSAAGGAPDATVALISVPGPHAFAEAMDALAAGLSVMVFSDNVPVSQEIRLKEEATQRGLLVMGPDCGTVSIGGVGLGFANVVRTGPVGLVAASGTGAQQLMCLLDAAGVGVSHCLGVGGRDLSSEVGARSTLQALDALDDDPPTQHIVVVSKPPAGDVARLVTERAGSLRTPVTLALLGRGQPDLSQVAERVVAAAGTAPPRWPEWHPDRARSVGGTALRGLFCGGTLCDEAMAIAADALGPIGSNIPLQKGWALPDDLRAPGHLMIDFGDDRLTRGRAHPMIDPTLRLDRLATELRDPGTGVVLLDVVLGHASHPDPAPDLAALVAESGPPVVVSLCGTDSDPQGLPRQAARLCEAGAHVFLSNAAAARYAVGLLTKATTEGSETA